MATTNINRVVLTGNLTQEPDLRSTQDGTAVCRLCVASNTRRKDAASGQWVDKPHYFDVTVFGTQATTTARYLSKGRQVAIDGRLDWREWNAQDGTTHQAVQIMADTVQFLGPAAPSTIGTDDRDFAPSTAGSSDDEIPF
jgi:single-strand DNA-binding protein